MGTFGAFIGLALAPEHDRTASFRSLAWAQSDDALLARCKDSIARLIHYLVSKLSLQVSDSSLEFKILVDQVQHPSNSLKGNTLRA